MPNEATYRDTDECLQLIAPSGGWTAGQVIQVLDGRAGYVEGLENIAAGDPASVRVRGQVLIPKTTGIEFLDGGECFFDHSANKGHFKAVNDRDFYAGAVIGDHASTDVEVRINLNVRPVYASDLLADGFASVLVGTPAAGGFGYPVNLGGALVLELTATNEAQKVDALGVQGVAVAANPIFRGIFRVLSDGASGSQDLTIGMSDGTHASDFQSVNAFAAFHLDGNVAAINAQSDDSVTDVAPVDTTKTYAEGAALANRVEVWIDGRDPAGFRYYVEGVRVNAATTFPMAAAGPLFPVVHLEKGVGTDVYKVAIDAAGIRIQE
jgi:hypothetical protein